MSICLNNLLVGSHSLGNLCVLQEISLSLGDHGLALVESFSLDLPLGLQSSHDVLVLPADLMAESSQRAELPATLQSEDLQSGWDDHLLLLVIGRRNSLECLQTLQGILASLGLVRNHSSDSSPEDLGGSPEVEGTTAGLHVATLLQEVEVLQLVAIEVP